jgi:NAD(P)-dependent dehydrogenase (short-subunit alcohol dehydrogenase family)
MLPIHPELKGRTAAITGGSGVLCRAMALELARQGVAIAILNRNEENGRKVAAEIVQAGGTAASFSCDVCDAQSVNRAEAAVSRRFGPCDILINGAGGNHPQAITAKEILKPEDLQDPAIASFFDIAPEAFSYVIDLNLVGTWLTAQAFAKGMLNRPGATIINISSMAAPTPATKVPAYSAAKAGVDNLTKWLAVHLADAGVRVNAIAPGFFLTEQNRKMLTQEDGSLTERSRKILNHTPMARFGKPEDLLGTLLWLVNEKASGFVTGITVPVDGGFMAYSGV